MLNKQGQQQHDYLQAVIRRRQLYLKAILEHLDNCLEIFNKQPHCKNLIIDALKDDDKFYQTLSELEISRALNKKYPIIPQPLINGKHADAIIFAQNNRRAIFEITSPDIIDKLKYIGFAADVKNKARQIIIDKISYQITKFVEGNNDLIFLVIDKSRAYDISPEDIQYALWGSPSLVLLENKDTGKAESTKWIRQKDALGLTVKDANRLSAVIFYGRSFQTAENPIKLEGQIIYNPYASPKVDDEIVKEIESALFKDNYNISPTL